MSVLERSYQQYTHVASDRTCVSHTNGVHGAGGLDEGCCGTVTAKDLQCKAVRFGPLWWTSKVAVHFKFPSEWAM